MPQCPYPCPANPLQGQTRTQPMRARTLGAAELVSHSLSNTPRPVPVGTVCAQNCSQHPSTAKASNDGTGPLIASLSRCGPAPQKQPLWTAWPQPTGRGIRSGKGGNAEQAASILGEALLQPTRARRRFLLAFCLGRPV